MASEFESPFDIQELFFSTTDLRGRITSGNDVFVRVSEYSAAELMEKPHSIVRHPDMPRTIFKFFWSEISAGRPIAAYVKNKTKNGKYYWVMAMAFPIENGYLSIRLKPSSNYFPVVQDLYKKILRLEEESQNFDQTLEFLVNEIKALGFDSYDQLIAKILVAELNSRDTLLELKTKAQVEKTPILSIVKKTSANVLEAFHTSQGLVNKSQILTEHAATIREACMNIKFIATNLMISTAKLGDQGKPLGVISNSLSDLMRSIEQTASDFEGIFSEFEKSISRVSFAIGVSRFQIEMISFLIQEGKFAENADEKKIKQQCEIIQKLIEANFKKVTAELSQFHIATGKLLSSIADLRKNTTGMDVIQIMGRIEISRLTSSKEDLLSQLEEMNRITLSFANSLDLLHDESEWGRKSNTQLGTLLADLGTNVKALVLEA